MKLWYFSYDVIFTLLLVLPSTALATPLSQPSGRNNATLASNHVRRLLSKRTPPRFDASLKGKHLTFLKGSYFDSFGMAAVAANSPTSGTTFERYFRRSDATSVHDVFQSILDTDPDDAYHPDQIGPKPFDSLTLYEGDHAKGHSGCQDNHDLLAYRLWRSLHPSSAPGPTEIFLCAKFWDLPVPNDIHCDEARTWTTATPRMVVQGSVLLHMWLLVEPLVMPPNQGQDIQDYEGAVGPYQAIQFKLSPDEPTARKNADNFHWFALESWWQSRCRRGEFDDPPPPPRGPRATPYEEIAGNWV